VLSGAVRPLFYGPSVDAAPTQQVERCPRCAAAMEWRHQTWQCGRCRFKLGCCEGESPDVCAPVARFERSPG
jgi:ribosomal protein S27AE